MPDQPKEPPPLMLPENPGEPDRIILIYEKNASPEEQKRQVRDQLRAILARRAGTAPKS